MFVTPAYAQGTGAGPDMLISILPFVLIFVIMYFLIIRPQLHDHGRSGEGRAGRQRERQEIDASDYRKRRNAKGRQGESPVACRA
jgi:hypothetical protein